MFFMTFKVLVLSVLEACVVKTFLQTQQLVPSAPHPFLLLPGTDNSLIIGPYVLTHLQGKCLARLGPRDYPTLL